MRSVESVENQEEEETIEENWRTLKANLQSTAKEVCGKKEIKNRSPWINDEYRRLVGERKRTKEDYLKNRNLRDAYLTKDKETKKALRRHRR